MRYNTYLGILVVSAVTAFWLTPLSGWLAFRIGAVDLPSERKVHRGVMPRLGGLAVYLAFMLSLLAVPFLQNSIAGEFRRFAQLMGPLFIGSLATLILGIYDDIRGADATKKLMAQIVIASGLWVGGFRIDSVVLPFLGPLELNHLGLPITVLWIVGVTNAVNLLDGIDGLVAGVTACMALSLAVINIFSQNVLVSILNLALAGACLGFLPHNHSPARIFLGDSGSLTIGMILSCISIISLFNGGVDGSRGASFILTVPLLLFALPLFDTTQVMYNRWRRNVSIFQADKGHVHHHLLAMGYDHRQAAWILYSVAIITGVLAIALSLLDLGSQFFLSILFLIMAVGFFFIWRSRLRDDTSAGESGK